MVDAEREQIERFVRLDLVDAFSKAEIHIDFLYSLSDELVDELVNMNEQKRKQRIMSIVNEFRKDKPKDKSNGKTRRAR